MLQLGEEVAVESPSATADATLAGSWVVINGVISPVVWVLSIVTLLTTLLDPTYNYP